MARIEPRKTKRVTPAQTVNRITRVSKLPPGMIRPNFEAMFDPDMDNPLDRLERTGDLELDTENENSATERSFIDNDRTEDDPFRIALDLEFYFVVCFQSRQQKEEFLNMAGLMDMGDKYIDGLRLARSLGVEIESIPLRTRKARPRSGLLSGVKIIPRGGDS